MMEPTAHCETIRGQLQAYALETLSEKATRAVAQHLEGCPACRSALEVQRDHLRGLSESLPVASPRPGLAERTFAHVTTEATARGQQCRPLAMVGGAFVVACLIAVVVLPLLNRSREAARRNTSQNQMKQWGIVFKMYANESEGERYPSLDREREGWVPDLASLEKEYWSDPHMVLSPSHPDSHQLTNELASQAGDREALASLMAENYAYLGYTVSDVADFEALQAAREGGRLEAKEYQGVLPLREGIERFLLTDINNPAGTAKAQSTIPVLIEIAGWKHKKSAEEFEGANVLYMDGHVEFVPFGTFPIVRSVLDGLSGLTG